MSWHECSQVYLFHGGHCIDRKISISTHILKSQQILGKMKNIYDHEEAMNTVSWMDWSREGSHIWENNDKLIRLFQRLCSQWTGLTYFK